MHAGRSVGAPAARGGRGGAAEGEAQLDGSAAAGGTGDGASAGTEDYEALRDRYWELAGVEGVSLEAFVEGELAGADVHDDAGASVGRLRRLVDDVLDTALKNIAAKAEEEGGVYERLADERVEEVREERARLLARLDRAAADATGAP